MLLNKTIKSYFTEITTFLAILNYLIYLLNIAIVLSFPVYTFIHFSKIYKIVLNFLITNLFTIIILSYLKQNTSLNLN